MGDFYYAIDCCISSTTNLVGCFSLENGPRIALILMVGQIVAAGILPIIG